MEVSRVQAEAFGKVKMQSKPRKGRGAFPLIIGTFFSLWRQLDKLAKYFCRSASWDKRVNKVMMNYHARIRGMNKTQRSEFCVCSPFFLWEECQFQQDTVRSQEAEQLWQALWAKTAGIDVRGPPTAVGSANEPLLLWVEPWRVYLWKKPCLRFGFQKKKQT